LLFQIALEIFQVRPPESLRRFRGCQLVAVASAQVHPNILKQPQVFLRGFPENLRDHPLLAVKTFVYVGCSVSAALKRAVAKDGKARLGASRDKVKRQAASASSCHSLLGSSISLPPIASDSVARS